MKFIFTFLAFLIYSCSVQAVTNKTPFIDNSEYSHYSNNEKISHLLETLTKSSTVHVIVSEKIKDTISGTFANTTKRKLFEYLIINYNLDWFYDGATLHVEPKSSRSEEIITLKVAPIEILKRDLVEAGVFQYKYRWKPIKESGSVIVAGPKKYISIVKSHANILESNASTKSIYSWRNKDGIMTFSNNPKSVPYSAKLFTSNSNATANNSTHRKVKY